MFYLDFIGIFNNFISGEAFGSVLFSTLSADLGKLYRYVIRSVSCYSVQKFKKHIAVDHCANFEKDHAQKK